MAFSKGRCPFPIDVDGRVVVALVRGPTGAGPDAVAQGDEQIEASADMAALTGRKPGVDVMHDGAGFLRHIMEPLDKRAEAQVRHFAAPQGLHAVEGQGSQHNAVVLLAELVRQFPEEASLRLGLEE